jgi:hypothetical protein
VNKLATKLVQRLENFGDNLVDAPTGERDDGDGVAPKTIRESRNRRWVAIVLTAFGDESHDERSERVFTVASLIGRQDEWDALEVRWRARTGGWTFHAAECESDRGEYAASPHPENLKLYADLIKLIADARFLGVAVSMDLGAFRDIFPAADQEQPYFLCFHDVVYEMAGIAHLHIPRETVKFTFDRNFEMEYNATYLYGFMAKQKEWDLVNAIDQEISFATRESVGIQAADLLAREAMKHRDNQIGPTVRMPRQSIMALVRTGRFRFIYHTREDFKGWYQQAVEMGKLSGAKMTEYRKWLEQNKLEESFSSKIKYLAVIGELNPNSDNALPSNQ